MKKINFDYSRLRGRIRQSYSTQDEFASAIGIGRVALSQRLNNKCYFSQSEILTSSKVLGFPIDEVSLYFFTEEVQKRESSI